MIFYKKGYLYQLVEDYHVQTELTGYEFMTDYISLNVTGLLSVSKGYAWDGPSGIAVDTKNFMRPSLIHDCFYQLLRADLLPQSCRQYADDRLKQDCIEDGMSKFRAWYVHLAVKTFAKSAADPRHKKKVLTAP